MKYQRLSTVRSNSNDAVAAVWPTTAVEAAIAPAAAENVEEVAFVPTPAMADLPSGVGRLLVGTYASLILVFFALFANSTLAAFSIVVCAFFVTMFFAVPRIFLAVEAAPGRRPSLDRFMHTGLDTLTGRTTGRDVLIQMLIVPVLVTLGLAAMGIIGKFYIG
jgi:hypothetical protein